MSIYFAYKLEHGVSWPTKYDKECMTNGNGQDLTTNFKQKVELPERHEALNLTELSKLYPYKEEGKQDEKFKI